MSLSPLDFVIASGGHGANFSSPMDYEAVIGLETIQLKTKSKDVVRLCE